VVKTAPKLGYKFIYWIVRHPIRHPRDNSFNRPRGGFFSPKESQMTAQERNREWHLEKSVSLGHIVSTVGVFCMLVAGYISISERIAILENQQLWVSDRIVTILETQRTIDARQDIELIEIKRQIREDFRDINQKLDRLVNGTTARQH